MPAGQNKNQPSQDSTNLKDMKQEEMLPKMEANQRRMEAKIEVNIKKFEVLQENMWPGVSL
jgi:hypothetical protein